MIFPYEWDRENKKYKIIDEDIFLNKYPLTYQYLFEHKEDLEKRDMDKNTKWYEYARSQGLNHSHLKKIVFNHIFDASQKKFAGYELPTDFVIYSGVYITAKNDESYETIKKILQSDEFYQYCNILGKDIQNGWKYITSRKIKEYGIPEYILTQ